MFSGKVEIGQGILTAVAQIVADELDVELARVRMVPATTAASPNEGVTSGSLSVEQSGLALRYACAEARAIFSSGGATAGRGRRKASRCGTATSSAPATCARATGSWPTEGLLDRDATARIAPKPAAARRIAGAAAARIDIPDKVFGRPRFIHDLALPGLLHARVLRPPSPGATLTALDEAAGEGRAGRGGGGARRQLRRRRGRDRGGGARGAQGAGRGASWQAGEALPDEADLRAWIKSQPVETTPINMREAVPGRRAAARTVRREYARPFIAHASMAPSCAIAQWSDDGLRMWTHTQGIYNLRADLALIFALAPERIVVEHAEGAGCYGQNGADDVALEAALLARAAQGRPVRLLWSREDEMAWAPRRRRQAVDLEADLDEEGEIVAWRHDVWGNGHVSRPGRGKTPTLQAAWQLAKPFPRLRGGEPAAGRRRRLGAQRHAALRFPGVAHHQPPPAHHADPHLVAAHARRLRQRVRHRVVHGRAGGRARRGPARVPPAPPEGPARAGRAGGRRRRAPAGARWQKREGAGHGLGFARYKGVGAYCAVVAEVEGDADIRVRRLVLAVDVGEAINPDGVVNQIEGGAIQATSWVLKEAVRFDRTRIASDTWETYPILRFSEVPAVEVEIIARPEEKTLGAGEAAHGPVAGAIANAVFDALGVRVRDLPITRERIVAAMCGLAQVCPSPGTSPRRKKCRSRSLAGLTCQGPPHIDRPRRICRLMTGPSQAQCASPSAAPAGRRNCETV